MFDIIAKISQENPWAGAFIIVSLSVLAIFVVFAGTKAFFEYLD